MKVKAKYLLLPVFSLLVFGFAAQDSPVKGWFSAGSLPDSYKYTVDRTVFKGGSRSLLIESTAKEIEGFATIMQQVSAKNYAGTKIKLTGYIKSENVTDWAGMWLRLDGKDPNDQLGFDNMQDRAVRGTADWTRYETVMDVPANCLVINFGILLSGTGKIWFDTVSIEVLDNGTAKPSPEVLTLNLKAVPENMDFEE
jgi:hypothetical protein